MKRAIGLTVAVSLLAVVVSPGFARAQVKSSVVTLPVQASVQSGCLVAAVGINFGAISPLIAEEDGISANGAEETAATADGDVILACGGVGPTSGTNVIISMDLGANGAIAPIPAIRTNVSAIRAMTNGTSFLLYDLFKAQCSGSSNPATGECTSGILLCTPPNAERGSGGASLVNPNGGATGFQLTQASYNDCLTNGVSAGSSFRTLPVCGSVRGDQVQPLTPGIYSDTVTVSILF
jgi:spore coat protein U-like protein